MRISFGKSKNPSMKVNSKPKKNRSKKSKITTLIIFSVIYVIILLSIVIVNARRPAIDKTVDSFVYDSREMFSAEQVTEMNDNCKYVQEKYGINVYISTCERYYGDAMQIGTDFLWEHSMSESDNLVVIILNCYKYYNGSSYFFDDYHFDIYTFGDSAKKITNNEIDKIVWSTAGDQILESTTTSATAGLIQMTKDVGVAYSWILSYRWLLIIIVVAIIAMIVALIVNKSIKGGYAKNRAVANYSFSANSKLELTVSEDVFSHKNVTYIRIERGSSGGGGGFSSGGGGGGGHRGGR